MNEHHLSLQDAVDWIARYHMNFLNKFEQLRSELPSWGPDIDREVSKYIDSLGQGIRGVDDWSFESQRYFGPKALEIKRTRLVTLLPRLGSELATPTTVFDVVAERAKPGPAKVAHGLLLLQSLSRAFSITCGRLLGLVYS